MEDSLRQVRPSQKLIELSRVAIVRLAGRSIARSQRFRFKRIRKRQRIKPSPALAEGFGIEEWIMFRRFATSNLLLTFLPFAIELAVKLLAAPVR
jgi:hypothetical protein